MHRRRARRGAGSGGGRVSRAAPALGTLTGLQRAAREYMWLYDSRRGKSPAEIAGREGCSVQTVRVGIRRAEAVERSLEASSPPDPVGRRLVPLFPIDTFTPVSACPHHGGIARGSVLCCMVCHESGMDRWLPSPAEDAGARAASRSRPEPAPRRKTA